MLETTIDTILSKEIKVCQPKNGFRFSLDSVLLARFVSKKKAKYIIDIGSGSGVIALLLHKLYNFTNIDALEYQESMYHCLNETIKLNSCENIIQPINIDLKQYKPKNKYNIMVSNPPYRKSSSGRVCNAHEENIARFDDELGIIDIFKFAKSYLENLGSLYISYDADLTEELLGNSRKYNLEPKRLRFFHPDINKPARLVFIEFKKASSVEMIVEPPIFQKINGQKNDKFDILFTEEAKI
ncbi:methyltransferase [Deferribacterales bacterium Es71-Z0220]|uniref:tRNA1(Val) (adenine(37)-N6)-methyltransferase n=1 Tax=Deferrivibrio essentukiensis TaxID=2880922 RepID=UPI001F604D05|nr:methyltransferase [Deferrivibrio essentukiensis]MCB4204647.1 methyltransferase [Deferrivibrio essentukiensis]